MALATHNITDSLKDAIGGTGRGRVTFRPYATHDSRTDPSSGDVLLGSIVEDIATLPDPYPLTAGGWRITIESTTRVQGRPEFSPIVVSFTLDRDYSWQEIVDLEVTDVPVTPTVLQQAQAAADEAEMWASSAGDVQDTAVATHVTTEGSATSAALSATIAAEVGEAAGVTVAAIDDPRFAGLPAPATTYYVNTVTGSNTNDGLTSGAPFATLSKAFTTIGNGTGTVKIHAPLSKPLREQAHYTGTGAIDLEPATEGAPWYLWGSLRFTSGWTSMGAGVYRNAGYGSGFSDPIVLSMFQTVGDAEFWLRLTKNTATPTTPGPGEYGISGSDFYIHLPGDVDPTAHQIEIPNQLYALRMSGVGARITARYGRMAFGRSGVMAITAGAGTFIAEDCEAAFAPPGASGFTLVADGTMELTRCRAMRNLNDGFNAAGTAVMTLTDCEGAYNGDEGASPHNTTTMRVIRGTYHHNGYSGIAAVNSATLVLEDPVLHDNHIASAPTSEGGLTLHETVTAYIFGLRVRDDAAAGVYAHNTTTVTRSGIVSGVAQGNALPDNWSATP